MIKREYEIKDIVVQHPELGPLNKRIIIYYGPNGYPDNGYQEVVESYNDNTLIRRGYEPKQQ